MTRLKAETGHFIFERRTDMTTQTDLTQLSAVASRLREMREIMGWTAE